LDADKTIQGTRLAPDTGALVTRAAFLPRKTYEWVFGELTFDRWAEELAGTSGTVVDATRVSSISREFGSISPEHTGKIYHMAWQLLGSPEEDVYSGNLYFREKAFDTLLSSEQVLLLWIYQYGQGNDFPRASLREKVILRRRAFAFCLNVIANIWSSRDRRYLSRNRKYLQDLIVKDFPKSVRDRVYCHMRRGMKGSEGDLLRFGELAFKASEMEDSFKVAALEYAAKELAAEV
jgi:hypothetical protein